MMSEFDAKIIRADRKKRMEKMLRADPHQKVDASGYEPPDSLDADVKTGQRPLSKRQFKRGGKVEGHHTHARADKKPRGKKYGGPSSQHLTEHVNTDLKEANEKRDGNKHVGGMKKGGRAHKADGGVPTSRFNFSPAQSRMSSMTGYKKGGKAEKFEGSAKDLKEDRVLAKKHHMTHKEWEASEMDEKHDRQKSMKGLKHGGKAGKWIQGAIEHKGALHKSLHVPMGEKIPAKKLAKAEHSSNPKLAKRAHLAETLKHLHRANKFGGGALSEGKAPKGKNKGTHINIMINPKGADAGMPGLPPGMPGMPPAGGPPAGGGVPVPMGMPPMGGGMPMGGAPMGAPPMPPAGGMPPMPRKAGGKVYRSYKDMDAGAGSGLGRIEKTEIQKRRG